MKFRLKRSTRVLLSTSAAGVLLVAAAGPGLGHQPNGQGDATQGDATVDSQVSIEARSGAGNAPANLDADLDALNRSGDSGDVRIEAHGANEVTVHLETDGVSPGVPHAQHIHVGGEFRCPTSDADQNGDGLISTAEGQPAYGAVKISLTTEGGMTAADALAVGRFPVANASGEIDYERTFTLPEGVSVRDLRNGTVVQHGITELSDDPRAFDGDIPSSLNPDLPIEATIPASCGELSESTLGISVVDDLLDRLGLGL